MSSSKIKGGGRAILSQESQQALIDLLMSLENNEKDDGHDNKDDAAKLLSTHEKKRQQKKFMKRLIHRHEQRQLQQKYNNNATATGGGGKNNATTNNSRPTGIAQPLPSKKTNSSSPNNVRIELAEAIFFSAKDNNKKKSIIKKKKSASHSNESLFKVGTKKVIVLPRTTSMAQLLKKSKSKLMLKKNPVRIFIQVVEDNAIFDLESDLTAVEDGTVVYVSLTPPPLPALVQDCGEVIGREEDALNDDIIEESNIIVEDQEDPLESVKRAYQQQEVHRRRQQQQQRNGQLLERVDEIIDMDKKVSFDATRSKLPVSAHKQQIVKAIHEHHVVVLSGATGSGKSTQVPQFLLDESSNNDSNSNHPPAHTQEDEEEEERMKRQRRRRPYIVVTQPRKVAAISLAHRVADERGCPPPGSKGSTVGYMVRGDRRVDLRNCRIIYMTIGILLRMLVNDRRKESDGGGNADDDDGNDNNSTGVPPLLSIDTISHLIIDETHERDVNTDFSLTLLKGMLSSSSSSSSSSLCPYVPRLVLMSATASSELFVSYFTTKGIIVPVSIEVPGRTFPVETQWLGDCEKFTGDAMITTTTTRNTTGKDDQKTIEQRSADNDNNTNSSGNRTLSPRATDKIDNRFIRSLIVTIVKEQIAEGMLGDTSSSSSNEEPHYRATGAILVFLPGMGEIESLNRCLYENGTFAGDRGLCKIRKLHSTIPKAEQRHVFQPAAVGTVKVVLATNIAETSVTIPDISHVIDACRVKESRYNPSTRIKELVTVWSSHASMKQRAGRAGRTSHGVCWRLVSEEFAEEELLPHTVPEMARTPLDELILQIGLLFEQRRDEYNSSSSRTSNNGGAVEGEKRRPFALGFKPIKFLSMTPTPPAEHGLMQACKHLLEVEALKVVDYGAVVGEQIGWLYRLTPLGYHLSRLPMDAKVGKMLIIGCLLGCLDNALTIAAALSCTKSCFLPNRLLDSACTDARDSLIENGFGGKDWQGGTGTVRGDLIAVIAAHRGWKNEEKRNRWKFCKGRALDNMSLCEMDTLRRQFFDLMVDAGLVSSIGSSNGSHETDDCNSAREDALLTSCCIVGGLYPNVCTLIRPTGPRGGGRLLTNDTDATCRPSSNSFQRTRVHNTSKSGKDAYAMYHAKHRSIGTVSSEQKRPPETFLSEVNFISKFALLLFGGELELVKNAIIVDKWLKFKVSSDNESVKQNAVLILSLRELLDKVVLEHVVETFSSPDEKAQMVERHKRIIEVVRRVLADEG